MELDVLPPEEATALLLERSRRGAPNEGEKAAAAELADALGGLPLALEQAGAYLASRPVAITDYLESFRRRRLELLERLKPAEGDYDATVGTTWEMSFQEMEEASPVAADALRVCAYLAPDQIPVAFFVKAAERSYSVASPKTSSRRLASKR